MHYKDGTIAQVGDLVKGTTYNTGGVVVVGTLVGITPGVESCNARVALAFVKSPGANSLPYPKYTHGSASGYAVAEHPFVAGVMTSEGYAIVHRELITHSAEQTHAEHVMFVGTKIDSTACSDLELIHRPG